MDALIGKVVAGVRRVLYEFQGEINYDDGPLELRFEDGSIALFDIDVKAGCTIQVSSEAWLDPFVAQLSDENAEYIRDFGKWSVFDVSAIAPASHIVGREVLACNEVMGAYGDKQIYKGVVIHFDDMVIEVNSWGTDEVEVVYRQKNGEWGEND